MVGSRTELDTILDLSKDQYRRIILAELAEEQRPLTLRDLGTSILAHNHQKPVVEASEQVQREILISLHHVHIPRLEAAGVVEYDPGRKLVKPTAQFDQWQPVLSAIVDFDPVLEQPVEL